MITTIVKFLFSSYTTFAFEITFSVGILLSLILFSGFKEKFGVGRAMNYAIGLLFVLMLVNGAQGSEIFTLFNSFYIIDNLAIYGRYLVCFLSILSIYATKHYVIKSGFTFEYVIVLLLAIFGLCLLLSTYDFISIYLAIELQSLASYVLAASRKKSTYSVEAGLKYFILGSFSSALMIFGMSLIYAVIGVTHLAELSAFVVNLSFNTETESFIFMIGMILFLSGILFKLGAAPFHSWVPDVYEGAPMSVSLFFAVVPKAVMFALLYRICDVVLFDISDEWSMMIFISSVLSLAMGSLGGLRQTKLKRLLAFSSINHVGYILMGILSCSALGTVGLVVYVTIYSFSSLLIWSILIGIEAVDENGKDYQIKYITDFKDFANVNRVLATVIVLAFFSMAGVPPLAGFFGKAYIFFAAIHSKLYFLACFAIIFSLISAYYYLRVIKQVYTDSTDYHSKIYFKPMNEATAHVIAFLTFFLVFFGFFSDCLVLVGFEIGMSFPNH